jgi:Protein of unknown function (DUF2510)/Short C-terminal domain
MSSPAGWYPQPDGQLRYWDGELWTEHFAPGNGPAPEVAPTADPVADEPTPEALDSVRHHKERKVMKTVRFSNAQYLGGLPGTKPTKASTTLFITDDGVGHGNGWGPKNPIAWDQISGVSFDTGTAKKSRAGKALAFGVFALAAKKTQDEAHLTVMLRDGNAALYRVVGKSGVAVRGRVQPFLAEYGVPCLDDGVPAAAVAPAVISAADEIVKLVALRDAGAITEEEFTAHKAKLLG